MRTLEVRYRGWDEDWLLGTLADSRGRVYFEFSPRALSEGLELSPLRCPLRRESYDRLPGLVSDSLPDGWGLYLMDRLFRQNGLNPAHLSVLDRLAFLGSRTMGALAFEPSDPETADFPSLGLPAMAEESRRLINDEGSEALRALAYGGGSPHGARPKVLVQFDPVPGRVSNSPRAPGEPWLIKFPAQGEHPEVCAVETLYADLARCCGIEVPETRYFDLGPGLAAFGVQRFDRHHQTRVPLLTLASALEVDYRIPSAVDYTGYLRMTRYLTKDEQEVSKAFLRCVFNVVFHNRDDHPKNFSYRLARDRRWTLSPAYDLTFAEGPGGEHHTDVCGEGRAPARSHLLRLAREADLKPAAAEALIDRVCEVAATVAVAAEAFPIRKATIEALVSRVEANRARAT